MQLQLLNLTLNFYVEVYLWKPSYKIQNKHYELEGIKVRILIEFYLFYSNIEPYQLGNLQLTLREIIDLML